MVKAPSETPWLPHDKKLRSAIAQVNSRGEAAGALFGAEIMRIRHGWMSQSVL